MRIPTMPDSAASRISSPGSVLEASRWTSIATIGWGHCIRNPRWRPDRQRQREEGSMIRKLDTMFGTAAPLEAASVPMHRDDPDTRRTLDPTVPVMAAIAVVVLLYLASRGGTNIAEESVRWAYALTQILGLSG